MGMRTYGLYEAVVPNSKLEEIVPAEYSALYDFMSEKDIDEWDMEIMWEDGCPSNMMSDEPSEEDWDELLVLIEKLRDKFYDKTNVDIYPRRIDSDADSENAGDVLWAAEFELSEKLQKVGAYLEVWTEVG
jgi:hypothetical protein